MRKASFNHNMEYERPVQSYVNDFSLKPIPQSQWPKSHRRQSFDFGINSKAESPLKHTRNTRREDARSVSQLDKNLYTIDESPNKTIAVRSNPEQNLLPPKTPELKRTPYNMRLPKLELIEPNNTEHLRVNNTHSLAIDTHKKSVRLQPLHHEKYTCYWRTKAGSNGSRTKTNQDAVIADKKLPFGLKIYCVCDGHGVNGHHVSGFIITELVSTVYFKLSKRKPENAVEETARSPVKHRTHHRDSLRNHQQTTIRQRYQYGFEWIHSSKLLCFNVGDSRAVLYSYHDKQWKAKALSDDQKPSREDQRQRILKAGGRIQTQRGQSGQDLGPLRVWMAHVQMPGLAMTRSFGDKAGVKAGTNGIPQVLQHTLTPNDKFIAIASDGVWQYIQNDDLMHVLTPFYMKNNLELGCERVINHATNIWRNVCLSRDDITIILVNLNQSDS